MQSIIALGASGAGGTSPILWAVLAAGALLGLYLLVKVSGFIVRSLLFGLILVAIAAAAWFLWPRH